LQQEEEEEEEKDTDVIELTEAVLSLWLAVFFSFLPFVTHMPEVSILEQLLFEDVVFCS
jgi:hypothetical protein